MHSFAFVTCHVNIRRAAEQWGSRAKEKDMKNQQEEPSDTLDGFKGKKNKEGAINKCDLQTLQFAEALRAWSAILVLTCSSQGFKPWCNTWLYVTIYLLSFIFPSPQQWTENSGIYFHKSIYQYLQGMRCIFLLAPQDQRDRHWKGAPHWRWRSDNCQPSNWGLVS